MKRRFIEEQIIGILKEGQASGVKATCAKHNISEATYYSWKRKYGGMEGAEARGVRALEGEDGRVKRLGGGLSISNPNLQRGESKKRWGRAVRDRRRRGWWRR